jgi:uncharacterized protein YjbI with pentapeptide repeats
VETHSSDPSKIPSAAPLPQNIVPQLPDSDPRVPALKLASFRGVAAGAAFAAIGFTAATILFALWLTGFPELKTEGTVSTGTLIELVKLSFAVVAGVGGAVALVVAYRRQKVAEHSNRLAELAHRLAHAADERAEAARVLAHAADRRADIESDRNGVRLLNERFAKAAEQLGSEKAAVRLAGVYAMAGLADDWLEQRQTCVDVLCAYIRMPYASPEPYLGENDQAQNDEIQGSREEREVRNTVLRLVAQHLRLPAEDPRSWQKLRFDFTSAVIDGADFSGIRIEPGTVLTFHKADLCFGVISFVKAQVRGVLSFHSSKLRGSSIRFDGAKIEAGLVSFQNAALSKGSVSFEDSENNEPSLTGGQLSFASAKFEGATVSFGSPFDPRFIMQGGVVKFTFTKFSKGKLWLWADLNGGEIDFEYAAFDGTEIDFSDVNFAGAAVNFSESRLGKDEIEYPPTFPEGALGNAPAGLRIPERWSSKVAKRNS